MEKAVFIIPFFGKFNNYFQLFLNSCARNAGFDWIIFTDDTTDYKYPTNVNVFYTTFEEIKQSFARKFSFPICLERPYKLCDFKVSYGYVFEEYLENYALWGHCDTDMIWGDISAFIKGDCLTDNDKLFFLGHCTLYKNDYDNNRVFMSTNRYKEVFACPDNCSFDEEFKNSINNLFIDRGKSILFQQFEANIYRKSSDFRITRYNFSNKGYVVEPKTRAYFIWDNGKLKRIAKDRCEEYMYIHMQSRRMNVRCKNTDKFKIIPNAFEDIEDVSQFENVKVKNINFHYFRHRGHNFIDKMRKKIERLTR